MESAAAQPDTAPGARERARATACRAAARAPACNRTLKKAPKTAPKTALSNACDVLKCDLPAYSGQIAHFASSPRVTLRDFPAPRG
jgi:hypothetical protein